MGIFQNSVLRNTKQDEALIAHRWASFQDYLAKTEAIKGFKEEIYQDGFLKDVFENCLGYTLKTSNPNNYSLDREQKNETDGKKADGAIYLDRDSIGGKALNASLQQTAHGAGAVKDKVVVGVIELKDQKSKNLDSIEAQAFGYHASHANSRYIIISNFDELRFYIDKKSYYEKFNLFNLDYEEFRRLHLMLSFESISSGLTNRLLEQSNRFEVDISKQLYRDFSDFRTHLFENIVKNNIDIDKQTLLRLTQKLCDRLVFILFAEDRGLLRPNTIKEIREEFKNQKFTSYTLYDMYKFYFDAISEGNDRLDIPQYNGGLFVKDELLDSLKIDDKQIDLKAQKLSDYDFMSDIGVNILGHIFEQSLSDIEELNASINDIEFDRKKSKRKKDGVFYTPEYITRYIVENTLGKLCSDKKAELGIMDIEAPKDSRKPTKKEQATKENLEIYRNWLLELKILDPACGSGAFLNQALEFLIREHKSLQQNLVIMGDITAFYDIEEGILEHNLYGVDINEDAVEIAKLSLWLRTAQKGRMLTNLSDKIVCANSLLDMPFCNVIATTSLRGGKQSTDGLPRPEGLAVTNDIGCFDVVIGNPPYVRQEAIKDQKEALSQKYEVYSGTADLYVYFYELAIRLLKPNGLTGFICSNKFFRAKYGENLRKYILEHTTIEEIADFNGVKVFEDATVDSAITIFKKAKMKKNHEFKVVDTDLENYSTMLQGDLSDTSFTFSNPAELIIKKKIEAIGTPLKEWDINIYRGVLTGFNEAFIIDGVKKDELIKKDPKSAEIIKPLLRGRDINKYSYDFADKWLINAHNNPPIDINNYSAIKEHLDQFYPQLEKRTDKGATPYNLRNCAYLKEFEKDKIIYPDIGTLGFCYDDKKMYFNNTVYFLNTDSKYILSILNSKVTNYWYLQISSSLGNGGSRGFKIFVEQIPIPKITETEQQPFIELVDEILEAKEKIKKYKKHFDTLKAVDKIEITEEIEKLESLVQNNENTIDQMVYKLYGLTSEEIKVVERS